MISRNFTRFFDKTGSNLNLKSVYTSIFSLYNNEEIQYENFTGTLFFPRVSVGLIESQNLYLLEEVTGPASHFELRNVVGEVIVTGGNPTIVGIDTDFTSLTGGNVLRINDDDFTVLFVSGATSLNVTPTPSLSVSTKNVYFYDYLSYSSIRSEIGTDSETITISLPDEPVLTTDTFDKQAYFIYEVDYTEDVPYIQKSRELTYVPINGSSDTLDPVTGRIHLSTVDTVPIQINIGLSANVEYIYKEIATISQNKKYRSALAIAPTYGSYYDTFYIGGTSHPLYDITSMTLEGGTESSSRFHSVSLEILEVGITGSNTYVNVVKIDSSPVSASNFSGYRLEWTNIFKVAELNLYGEVEAEDERLKLTLENFGKKIDYENEYIFRDSDIKEELIDYKLLNQKRKELLLEGDNIYPYLGSYKALINIINFFGYYDVRIKEYFLNVDSESSNYGKYTHILVPRDSAQREIVKAAWRMVPSKILKKTSLFGLFYDLNRTTGEYDEYGIPETEDSFDFSPDEVLVKLFGLKELLKKEYLPLNARIYDITGEGIYFERIRIDSWVDNVNTLTLDIGRHPQFTVNPPVESYISDLRRIDKFYKDKFIEQGLSGFLTEKAIDPSITAGWTGSISSLFGTYLDSYDNYNEAIYDKYGNFLPVIDQTWQYMPPGIDEPQFNQISARLNPLADEKGIVIGAPVLLEAFFNVTWEESFFSWSHLGILGPTGAPINVNIWTWDSVGRGEYIDMRWTLEKHGDNGFYYDSGRRPIDDFVKATRGTTAFSIPGKITVSVSGGSISDVFVHSGYGYTSSPTVHVPSPDMPGTTATILLTVNDGFISGATWTGGSGYSYPPTVTVAPPPAIYETVNKVLHAVALPYEGEYDIALYNYDITNNYTVQFQKYRVRSREADFSSVFRSESLVRVWEEFSDFSWEEVNGPWYYPNIVSALWEDCKVSWKSMDYVNFMDQSLFDYPLLTKVHSIDRENSVLTITGDMTGNLPNSLSLEPGSFIFLSRDESDPIVKNLKIPVDSFGSQVRGLSGGVPYSAVMNGAIRTYYISTTFYDTRNYVKAGDSVWVDGEWYKVSSVGATAINVTTPIVTTFTGNLGLLIPSNLEVEVGYTGSSEVMQRYSRLFVSDCDDYDTVDPTTDFYDYVNGLTSDDSNIIVNGELNSLQYLILRNSSLGDNVPLYATWGIYAGTYAQEITNISLASGNTQLRLSDPNNELYYLDGNFAVNFSDYDLDYAETRIGASSLIFENANEMTWDENPTVTWFGAEYHGDTLCGYIIPFVAPGGSITVDEEPSFFFSGDMTISSTKEGLVVASTELNISRNSGTSKYDYCVLPDKDLVMMDSTGSTATYVANYAIGATMVELSVIPYDLTDNYFWTGYEWKEIIGLTGGSVLVLGSPLAHAVEMGSIPLLPYNYHKQIYLNSSLMQQFYYFIHGKAKNPSGEMLSYINFDNGVESEWLAHPNRTYTYPLRNSLLQLTQSENLCGDLLYEKWVYEGSDYPPLNVHSDYSSDRLSYESRVPYLTTLQNPYTFIDTYVSDRQNFLYQFTPVVFHHDNCRIPGKKNSIWTVKNDDTGQIEVISNGDNLMWNFTKPGKYSVSLSVEDSNGNKSFVEKKSFFMIEQILTT